MLDLQLTTLCHSNDFDDQNNLSPKVFTENIIRIQHMFTDHFRAVMLSDKLKDLLLLLLAIEVHSSLTGAM
jgi:hypothetical protein